MGYNGKNNHSQEEFPLKKLYQAVDRFCAGHPRFGIPNLMRVIVAGTVVVYLLEMFAGYEAVSFLSFNLEGIKRFELWRDRKSTRLNSSHTS